MITFYNVRTRAKVDVEENKCSKIKYILKNKQVRYALRTKIDTATLTKFISKEMYDSLNIPVAIY